jgi:hypothetical protein
MITLYVLFCAKWDNNTKYKQMNESKLEKKHILSFKKYSCHNTYADVI